MVGCYTGNPVMDAEIHQQNNQKAMSGRDYIICDKCKGKIYKEDALYEGDDYYELDGMCICEECIDEYLKECKRKCVA